MSDLQKLTKEFCKKLLASSCKKINNEWVMLDCIATISTTVQVHHGMLLHARYAWHAEFTLAWLSVTFGGARRLQNQHKGFLLE